MDKKWKLSILVIILILAVGISISVYFLVSTNNSNNTNEKVFSVDGSATLIGNVTLEVPVHKRVNQTIWFAYVPYKNGIPSVGSYCVVPQGIDTTHTFNLEVDDPNMSSYDSVDIQAYNNQEHSILLQKENVIIPKN